MTRPIILTMLLLPACLFAQGRVIELRSADVLKGQVLNGENVRELIGRVHFVQPAEGGGFVRVWCDRAMQYLQQNKIDLFGNVKVIRDSVTITASEGTYDGNTRQTEMRKNVRLVRGASVLTAENGRYFTDQKRAFFFGNVVLVDSASVIHSREMTFYETESRSVAVGDVRADDAGNATTVFGDSLLHFEREQYSLVLRNPRLVQIDTAADGSIDTMLVTSLRMESYQDASQRFVAIDSVRMSRGDMAAVCGRAVAYNKEDRIVLQNRPVVWSAENQITGDTITIRLQNNSLRSIFVRGRAMAVSRADSLRKLRFNQLTGKQLTLNTDNGKVRQVDVERNATSLYYLFDEATPNGLNKSSGDRIFIDFENGQVNRIKIVGGVQGEYYPEKMLRGREPDYNLEGFRWLRTRPYRMGLMMTNRNYD